MTDDKSVFGNETYKSVGKGSLVEDGFVCQRELLANGGPYKTLTCDPVLSDNGEDKEQVYEHQYDCIGSLTLSRRGSSVIASSPLTNRWDTSDTIQMHNIPEALENGCNQEFKKGEDQATHISSSSDMVIGGGGDLRVIQVEDSVVTQLQPKVGNKLHINSPNTDKSHVNRASTSQVALNGHGKPLQEDGDAWSIAPSEKIDNNGEPSERSIQRHNIDSNDSVGHNPIPSMGSTNNEIHLGGPVFIVEPYGSIEGELAGSDYEATLLQQISGDIMAETEISGQICGFNKADLTLRYDESGRQEIMLEVLCNSSQRYINEAEKSNKLNFHIHSGIGDENNQKHHQAIGHKQMCDTKCMTTQDVDVDGVVDGTFVHTDGIERFCNEQGSIMAPSPWDTTICGISNVWEATVNDINSIHDTTPYPGYLIYDTTITPCNNVSEPIATDSMIAPHEAAKCTCDDPNRRSAAHSQQHKMEEDEKLWTENTETPATGQNHTNYQTPPNIICPFTEIMHESSRSQPEPLKCMNTTVDSTERKYNCVEMEHDFERSIDFPHYVEAILAAEDPHKVYETTSANGLSMLHHMSDRREQMDKGDRASSVTKFASLLAKPQKRLEEIDEIFYRYGKSPLSYHKAVHAADNFAGYIPPNVAPIPEDCLMADGTKGIDLHDSIQQSTKDNPELNRANATTIRIQQIPYGRVMFYGLHGPNYQYVTTLKHPEFKHDSTCNVTTNELGFDSEESFNRSLNAKSEIIIRPPATLGGPVFFRGNVAKSIICRQDYIANSVFQINWEQNKLRRKRKGALLKCCTVD
ncbi:hypothetical protein X943_001955 [Babesia divergens]|uniref:Uncharacterized protein n=1 Tax=Babesia divergens TaxID=32595 RepID=A0AAD9GD33_BABDI|nr:hypothetical protein X943_001955 [Babesia divergens]